MNFTGSGVTATAALSMAFFSMTVFGQHAKDSRSSVSKPLMVQLGRFSAPGVPALSASETEVAALTEDRPAPANLPGRGLAEHPMLYVGEGYNRMLLVNGGKTIWSYSTGPGWEYDDVWMLSNGNILFTRMQYVAEVTPEKKIVWRYDAPPGTEIHTCQPIGLNKVLFVLNGLPPKLMVVDIASNKVEVEHVLPATSTTDPKSVHGQFRRVRYTAQGTYLVSFLQMNKVVEYNKQFEPIWEYEVKSPWASIRLKNGNTLITDEKDVLAREVNSRKETVWELRPGDLPEQYRYENAQTATRLANGNTIICSRGGSAKGPQLIEVTPDKRVVWVLWDWHDLGPATAVQILDDPGVPEIPGQSEH